MDELLNSFTTTEQAFSTWNFIINIIICCGLLYLLSLLYTKYGKSISNRYQLARVLIIVGLTTFTIISIVKTSLALSLGLVGALSIIRFRTAIKEPEELGYFFISIAIGLGLGANQLLPTIIGFGVIVFMVVILNVNQTKNFSQNLLITLKNDKDVSNQLVDILSKNTNQIELKRFKTSQGALTYNFQINVSNLENINRITESIEDRFGKDVDITFIDNQI